jgi:hypothetical protein
MKHGTFTVRSGRVINELPISSLAQRFGKLCLNFASNKIRIFKKSCIEFWDQCTVISPGSHSRRDQGGIGCCQNAGLEGGCLSDRCKVSTREKGS